jgi:hypothetical protein
MNCINIKSSEYKELLEASKLPSLLLEMRIAKWQETNGLDKFPKVENVVKSDTVDGIDLKNQKFRKIILGLQNQTLTEVSLDFTNYIFDNTNSSISDLLNSENINKESFNKLFNDELNKENPSNWFKELISKIIAFFNKDKIAKIYNSIKDSYDKGFFEDEASMLIYGINSSQKSKIPFINELLYRSITPANYNAKRIAKKGIVSLFTGRDYSDFITTIQKWRDEDVIKNIEIENKKIPKWATEITEEQYSKREDAWRLSNGLSQKHNSFKYVGKGYLDENYNLIESDLGENIYGFVNPEFESKDISHKLGIDKSNAVMGKYAIKIGNDEVGYYTQYNDRWDLDINTIGLKQGINLTQKPFIVTGKIYHATTFDESGNPENYYTQNIDNVDIKNYNELLSSFNTLELLENNEEEIDELKKCPL